LFKAFDVRMKHHQRAAQNNEIQHRGHTNAQPAVCAEAGFHQLSGIFHNTIKPITIRMTPVPLRCSVARLSRVCDCSETSTPRRPPPTEITGRPELGPDWRQRVIAQPAPHSPAPWPHPNQYIPSYTAEYRAQSPAGMARAWAE